MPNIIINNYCDLQCPYCFNTNMDNVNTKNITIEQTNDIIKFIDTNIYTFPVINLIGGEPLLHPDIEKICDVLYEHYKDTETELCLFTNGLNIDKHLELFKNVKCSVNLNSPADIGYEKYNKIIENLYLMKEKGLIDKVRLGINIYPDLLDTNYIFEVIERFDFREVRCGFIVPANKYATPKQYKDNYYLKAKSILIPFIRKCEDKKIKALYDCFTIPLCYFSEEELELLPPENKRYKAFCSPIIDIDTDMTAFSCFGVQEKVDLKQFKDYQEAYNYIFEKVLLPKHPSNRIGKCMSCEKFDYMKCQGGCLSFV